MSELQKKQLLEEFQQYLEHADLDSMAADAQPDLHTLLIELAGLKSEVKAEARQFKQSLDTLASALTTVQKDNQTLTNELAIQESRATQQAHDTFRSLLLDIVDLYDRLSIGFTLLQQYRPVNALFNHSHKRDIHFVDNFKEGQAITLKRFEQFLQRHQIHTLDCLGKAFDPNTMIAVELGVDAKQENGLVLEELHRGFLIKGQVLRLAEVKVNKK